MKQEPFKVEQFMDKYETGITYNMGETCCDSLSIRDVVNFIEPSERQEASDKFQQKLLDTKLVYGYIKGSDELKKNIAKVYNDTTQASRAQETGGKDAGVEVVPEDIVVTNGAIGANFLCFYSLVGPGDRVLAVDPSYQQLSSVPNLFSNGNLIKFELQYEDKFQPNIELFSELVAKHKPKLVILNNPHNPTGVVWSTATLEKLVRICESAGSYILCDEVYRPLFHSTEKTPRSILDFGYEKTISTSSMSKAFSLAGVRLGWAVTKDKSLADDLWCKRDYNTISISMIDDIISTFALNHYKAILDRNYKMCRANLEIVQEFIDLSNGAISWIKPIGGSTGFIKFNNKAINTMELCENLAINYQTLMVPGEVFEKPGYARIGFGNSADDLKGGLRIVNELLKNGTASSV